MSKLNKKFVPHYVPSTENQQDNFESLINSLGHSTVKEGTVVKGQVIKIAGNQGRQIVVVDVGLKADGRIAISEFISADNPSGPQEGDIVEVYVHKIEGRGGRTVLSRKQAVIESLWGKLVEIWEKDEQVEGVILERVKGGFVVKLGVGGEITAFLPGSQVDLRPVKDISSLLNITQPFKILKITKNTKDGNIVVSRRAILEVPESEAKKEMLANIKEGMILEGIVKNITPYGAFIELGSSVDGLLHLTDMSWSRINHPSEMLVVSQKVQVMVTKFNEETKRISLGLKQLDDNPWKNLKEEFPVGTKMVGKVTNFVEYGAFIELKDGIEGLVHCSEISWIKANQNPKKSLTIGQEIEFIILDVDTQKHRISLSIKQCQENPLIKFAETHPAGTIVTAPIKNINEYGIAVNLENNIDGFIHESDIVARGEDKNTIMKSYKKGEEIDCVILSVEIDKERVKLTFKDNGEDIDSTSPLGEFKKNMTVQCTISEIQSDSLKVVLLNSANEAIEGLIKKAELSSEKVDQVTEKFNIGDKIEAKITNVDKKSNIVHLSIKALEKDIKQKALKEYANNDSSSKLGDILGAAIEDSKSFR